MAARLVVGHVLQFARARINCEYDDAVVATIRTVDKTSVGRDGDFSRRVASLKARRQCGDRLECRECSG